MNIQDICESVYDYNIHEVDRDDASQASTFYERLELPFQRLVAQFGEPEIDAEANSDVPVMWGLSVHYSEKGSEAEKYNEPEIIDLMFSMKRYDEHDHEYTVYSQNTTWMLHGPSFNSWEAKQIAQQILKEKIPASS